MVPFAPSEYLPLLALGTAVGLFGTLIGAGGGFVLMPILLLLYPHASADELTAISLAVVFFNAVAGSEAYAFMGRIDYKSGLIFAVATIPGAVIGAISTEIVPRHLFNGIFGILLIAVAIFLVMRPEIKPRSELHTHRGHTWPRGDLGRRREALLQFQYLYRRRGQLFSGLSLQFSGDRRRHHPRAGIGLLFGFSGAHRHGYLPFRSGHHGVDRHGGAHVAWFLSHAGGSKANHVPGHWGLIGSAHRGATIQPYRGTLDYPQPGDGPGAGGTPHFDHVLPTLGSGNLENRG